MILKIFKLLINKKINDPFTLALHISFNFINSYPMALLL